MTDNEQRIAIAEALGWAWYRRPATGIWAKKPMRTLYHPKIHSEYVESLDLADGAERQCNETFIWREGMVPDFTQDLNAMHDAESTLFGIQCENYARLLCGVGLLFWPVAHASASQRAEAFLRTLGRWHD